MVPFLVEGLKDNWRCVYLGSPEAVDLVRLALSAKDVDTEGEQRRGALVLTHDRSYLVDGVFVPEAVIDGLHAASEAASRDGFAGLCATGDMRWELERDENFDRIVEYEARLEQVFQERPLRSICQYHRGIVPARAIHDALVTHRSAYLGTTLLEHDNPFYVPPELLLDPSAIARRAEWMCRQLLRILEAERVRDELLAELRRRDADQRRLADDLTSIKRGLEHRLADRTAELEVANQHLAAFSYSVSHDLRAPLRAIESFSQLLAADYGARLGPDGSLHLSRVRRNARHMSKLIEGMLTFGRVVNAELNYAIIDVTALASAVVRELQDAERTRRAEIFIQPGMRAVADPTLLRSVMSNLIGNAWKFTARTPLPRVEVGHRTDPDGRVVFFVRDNGAGFDMSNASRLFGVFQRLHEQDEFPGTGVGLATVERIVKRHGGQIWAEGRPGQGATFYFTLPIRALSN